ncbi:MAG: flagellar motor switch protein FliG, partial [Oscillospiraceae bacterium]
MTIVVDSLTMQQRAAAVIISLGAETASNVYKYLSEDEIEQLTIEISGLKKITNDETEQVLNNFYQMCLTQK